MFIRLPFAQETYSTILTICNRAVMNPPRREGERDEKKGEEYEMRCGDDGWRLDGLNSWVGM